MKMTVTIKMKKRLMLYIWLMKALYMLKLNSVADKWLERLLEDMEGDIRKYITIT